MKLGSYICISILCLWHVNYAQTSGQNTTNSPYSNFGIGEINHINFIQTANLNSTYSSNYGYSLYNPATVGYNTFTNIDFGIRAKTGYLSTSTAKNSFNGGGFSYLSMAFPIAKNKKIGYGKIKITYRLVKTITGKIDSIKSMSRNKLNFNWGSYLNAQPISSIGYNYTIKIDGPPKHYIGHSGSGGLSVAQWGNGVSLGNFSAGFSLGYVFGSISELSQLDVPDSANYRILEDEIGSTVSGFQKQFGLMYRFKFDSSQNFVSTIGFGFRNFSNLSSTSSRLSKIYSYTTQGSIVVDTIQDVQNSSVKFTIPKSFNIGYNFIYKRKLQMGFDYFTQDWSNSFFNFNGNDNFTKAQRYTISAIINPSDTRIRTEKKLKYRWQFGYTWGTTQNAFVANNTKVVINEKIGYIGLGIPLSRSYFDGSSLRTLINLQLSYTQRGTTNSALVKENFWQLGISMNLGDIWFLKRASL